MRLGDLKFETLDDAVVARATGEIDMSNAGEMLTAITEATPNGVLGVVLDLSEVDYVDSAGIHLMFRLRESLRNRGQALRIMIPADSPINDALRLAGVERTLDVVKTVDVGVQELAHAS
jgi:anti-sigma B factor antagonist